jgi:hypothetical protein
LSALNFRGEKKSFSMRQRFGGLRTQNQLTPEVSPKRALRKFFTPSEMRSKKLITNHMQDL